MTAQRGSGPTTGALYAVIGDTCQLAEVHDRCMRLAYEAHKFGLTEDLQREIEEALQAAYEAADMLGVHPKLRQRWRLQEVEQ